MAREVQIADVPAAISSDDISGCCPMEAESYESVKLGDDVWVGAGAVLLRGAWIGDGTLVGASTVVDFNVPAFTTVAGNPARFVGSVLKSTLSD